jgi:hypothetical protein
MLERERCYVTRTVWRAPVYETPYSRAAQAGVGGASVQHFYGAPTND